MTRHRDGGERFWPPFFFQENLPFYYYYSCNSWRNAITNWFMSKKTDLPGIFFCFYGLGPRRPLYLQSS